MLAIRIGIFCFILILDFIFFRYDRCYVSQRRRRRRSYSSRWFLVTEHLQIWQVLSLRIVLVCFAYKYILTIKCTFINVAPARKKKGLNLQKAWEANWKRPLRIMFDTVEHTQHQIGENEKLFPRCVGNQVKFFVPHVMITGRMFQSI